MRINKQKNIICKSDNLDILKYINFVRGNLMRLITKDIGNAKINHNYHSIQKGDIKRILICRPNHKLGNQLLITPLIQDVTRIFPNCSIDLFLKGNLGPILFKNHENIDIIIQLPKNHFEHISQYIQGWFHIRNHQYDMVINATSNSSSGRLSTKLAHSKYKFYGEEGDDFKLKYTDYQHIAKYPIYGFRNYLSRMGIICSENEIPSLDIKLSAAELSEGKKTLQNLVEHEGKTICLFTNATGSKCYSEMWWLDFYERLKSEYTNVNIIEVLPAENISKISFKEPSFYSKDIREIGALISNTDIFIGADSGIMHLACAVNTPTIGLFSVTSSDNYGPYGNKNLSIDTNVSTIDEIIFEIDKIICHTSNVVATPLFPIIRV